MQAWYRQACSGRSTGEPNRTVLTLTSNNCLIGVDSVPGAMLRDRDMTPAFTELGQVETVENGPRK